MKRNISMLRLAAVTALLGAMGLTASALPTGTFATHSALASGKWVKVSVDADGIYQLTAEQLAEMGFSDPARVAVYGSGGHPISEVLNGSHTDDLQPVASMLNDGRLYFYARGPVNVALGNSNTSGLLAFSRDLNAYDLQGHYFLTEQDSPLRVSKSQSATAQPERCLSVSYNYWYHERELASITYSGKDLLGEEFANNNLAVPFTLPQVAGPTITVGACCAAKSGSDVYIVGSIEAGGTTTPVGFDINKGEIKSIFQEERYNEAMPHQSVTLPSLAADGNLLLSLVPTTSGAVVNWGRLDYAIITYSRNNTFDGDEPQFHMWYSNMLASQSIALPGCGSGVMVWDVTDPSLPTCYVPAEGDTPTVSPVKNATTAHFVAFDPAREQLAITDYEAIDCQDLHAMQVPEMLIVTCATLMAQAERIADLHRQVDGMTVAVVDQQQVFNEFSSGTRDAMALRLMCKMLYDREPATFKNLLLLGAGTHDNRGITTTKPCAVITYESDCSNNESASYPPDDFFGFLDDGSGASIARCVVRIGVGRMLARSEAEAASDVDKLIDYVTGEDYGVWHNSALIAADQADNGLHCYQAEGINNLLVTGIDGGTGIHPSKAYVDLFPRSASEFGVSEDKRSCPDAKRHIIESLNAGQYFMTYIGHGGGSVFSADSKLWNSRAVQENHYGHWPILSTACCNVARFDSNQTGVAEVMYHERNGGAIAVIAASRDVESTENDNLNRAFTSALFTQRDYTPTLGQVYMATKQAFGTNLNHNKLAFFLLGDPAIKVRVPKPRFSVTAVAGEPVDGGAVTISPMQRVAVQAQVLDAGGNLDASFNGPATLTLYGPQKYYTTYTQQIRNTTWSVSRDIYYERAQLAQVEGKVMNGVFEGDFVVPRDIQPVDGQNFQLSLFAHNTGTELMVNGICNSIALGDYDEQLAEADNAAPVIEDIYLNSPEAFAAGSAVGSDAVLYVTATDDTGIDMQSVTPGGAMRVALDGAATVYYTVKNHAECSDGGRTVNVRFPLSGLTVGRHTLTYTVHDLVGNSTARTISFVVADDGGISLGVAERPAVTQATFDIYGAGDTTPPMALKVTNASGELVWTTTATQFPVVWNLTDADGQRVPAGLYKFFGTYSGDTTNGGTGVGEIVVIDPLHAQSN